MNLNGPPVPKLKLAVASGSPQEKKKKKTKIKVKHTPHAKRYNERGLLNSF